MQILILLLMLMQSVHTEYHIGTFDAGKDYEAKLTPKMFMKLKTSGMTPSVRLGL